MGQFWKNKWLLIFSHWMWINLHKLRKKLHKLRNLRLWENRLQSNCDLIENARVLRASQIKFREFFGMVQRLFHNRVESTRQKLNENNYKRMLQPTPISLMTLKSSKSKNMTWLMRATTWGSVEVKLVLAAKYWIIACESVTTNPSASSSVGTWCCLFIAKNCGVKCSLLSKSMFFN